MSISLLLAGSTGLVGSEVLRQASGMNGVERLIVLARRPAQGLPGKATQWIAPDDLLAGLQEEPVDAVICCLGTTIAKVGGDRRKFIHVDKDLVVGLGAWARRNQVKRFCVVSAVGADPRSPVFYSRVKGEMEEAMRALDLPALFIFHPSILTGPRSEFRFGERLGIILMTLFAPLMIGGLAKYRPMPADLLARALLKAALSTAAHQGSRTYTYRGIKRLAST